MITNSGMYLMGRDVSFYDFEKDTINKIYKIDGSRLMGIVRKDNILYLANHKEIFKADISDTDIKPIRVFNLVPNPKAHHMILRDNKLLIVATMWNSLLVIDLTTKKVKVVKLAETYKHMNCVFEKDNFFYITFNQSNIRSKEDYSCVHVLNSEFEEVGKFEYGWQSHGFCIIDNKKYSTCNFWYGQKGKRHPQYGGLMVDGEIVFKFENDEFFKDISVDDEYIYVSGGTAVPREERKFSDGIIYVFDREYNLDRKIVVKNAGEFNGCLLNNYDLTN